MPGNPSVVFVGDLHLGHRTILEHSQERREAGSLHTVDEHDEWVIQQMLNVQPSKRTLWWILGDVAMSADKLELLREVPGRKRLVLGNHDVFPTELYLEYFESVHGMVKKYNLWLSHAPIHPIELRGKPNVHGHCHREQLRDARYLNVAIDHLPDMTPVTLDEVRRWFVLQDRWRASKRHIEKQGVVVVQETLFTH